MIEILKYDLLQLKATEQYFPVLLFKFADVCNRVVFSKHMATGCYAVQRGSIC